MKIIKCLHVTQTERKHLAAFLESGRTQAKVNTKYYTILSGTPIGKEYEYEIRISTPTKRDNGEEVMDNQTIVVRN